MRTWVGLTFILILGCAATASTPPAFDVVVQNDRPVPVRVRAADATLPSCDVPAHATRRCAVFTQMQGFTAQLAMRPLAGGPVDTLTIPLRAHPPAIVRLPWTGHPYLAPETTR